MGFQKSTNAKKVEFESISLRTFYFERILNNNSQDPDGNFLKAFDFKDSHYFTSKEFS